MKKINIFIMIFIVFSYTSGFASLKCSSLFDRPAPKQSILKKLSVNFLLNKYAEAKLKKMPFDVQKFENSLAEFDAKKKPEDFKTIEELSAYYVGSSKKIDSDLNTESLFQLQSSQKLKLFNILNKQIKTEKASEKQLKIIGALLYTDAKPSTVKIMDLVSKSNLEIKVDDLLLNKYKTEVISGNLVELWKKNGLLTSKNKLLQFFESIKNPYINTSLVTIMNAAFFSTATVVPYSLKGIEFSHLEIQQGILYGPSAFFKTIKMRYGNRLKDQQIMAYCKKVTIALSVAATTLISMSNQRLQSLEKFKVYDDQIEATHKENAKSVEDTYKAYLDEAAQELSDKAAAESEKN